MNPIKEQQTSALHTNRRTRLKKPGSISVRPLVGDSAESGGFGTNSFHDTSSRRGATVHLTRSRRLYRAQ